MSVRLADVIDVLDAAYPPRLAQDWDSVGLVCGDPDDDVGLGDDRGRRHRRRRRRGARRRAAAGASPVAAARRRHRRRQHGQGRTAAPDDPNRAGVVHRPHQRRLGLARCVRRARRRAGADRRGGAGADAVGADLDKWVVFVPAENADAVREAMFAAGAGHIGDYSHCSWSVTGTGQFLPHDGASPTIGSVGSVERVAEDRVEIDRARAAARPGARGDAERAPLRGARVRHLRAGAGARRCRAGSHRHAAETGDVDRVRLPRARRAARHVVGGTRVGRSGRRRCRGSRCAVARATRCWTSSRAPASRPT